MQEKVEFASHGLTLKGILHTPDSEGPFQGIVFSHGYLSGKDGSKATYLGEWAEQNDVAFLRFDFSGVGESDGKVEDLTITKRVQELQDAITFLSTHKKVTGNIIVIGSSFGGLTSLLEATRDDRVEALVEIAPLTRLIPDQFRKLHKERGVKMRQDFYIDMSTYRVHPMLGQIKVPVYIYHGELDDVVPIEQSQKALKWLEHAVLTPLPGTDHDFEEETFTELMEKVTAKLKELIDNRTKSVQ